MNLRLFVAVELPEPVVESLSGLQTNVRRDIGEAVRWTDPRGTHLTIKFLGDTDERRVPELERGIEDAARGFAPFALSLANLGCFPSARRPRVLWVGLAGQTDELARLHASVETALARLRIPRDERGFSPHLTLGRVRDGVGADDLRRISRVLESAPLPAEAEMMVREVSLMRSVLGPKGAAYTRLFAAALSP